MLVDDIFWLQFRQAKTSLFGALLNPSTTNHVLSVPPSLRDTTRTETNNLISSLLEVEHELEAFQNEAKRVRESVSRQRAAAETSLRPIGMLPSELIHEVVSHIVATASSYRQIFYLSHISKIWRQVVIEFSALFTEANWEKWPVWLVDTWCSRAGPHLLKVHLQNTLRHAMWGKSEDSHGTLLRKLSARVGKLKVVTSSFSNEFVNHAAGGVLDLHMPSLKYLDVRGVPNNAPRFYIRAENIPAVQVLELTAVDPQVTAPLTSVIGLRYDPHPQRVTPRIFSCLPNLQHLALSVDKSYYFAPETSLQRLISLEVRWITQRPFARVLDFFDRFSCPSLQSLILHDEFFGPEDYSILLLFLGRSLPDLRTFYSCNDFDQRAWNMILPILTNPTAIIFPGLQAAVFLVKSRWEEMCTCKDYNLLREFVLARQGTLTRLSIPPVKNMDILIPLRDHIDCLEVSDPISYPIHFHSEIGDKLFPLVL